MIIAVLGDVHGRIDLAYRACWEWQNEHQKKLDLILQVGDLGVYSDLSSLDETTRKKSIENPLELNLYHALRDTQKYEAMLKNQKSSRDIDAPLYFVDGNHDDQRYLETLKRTKTGADFR